MKDKNKKRPVKKEQLYPEQYFLGYCQRDDHGTPKIANNIGPTFLRACEKDGFIKPLLSEKRKGEDSEGNEQEVDINFYSPFQIFLISALSGNTVDEEGYLRDFSFSDLAYQKEHSARYIGWGGWTAFLVETAKTKTVSPDYFGIAEDFHNLALLIHSFDEDRYSGVRDKRRLYTRLPSLQYDLKPLEENKDLILIYQLNLEKLKRLLHTIGYYATKIDPLENWYYYISRHSQFRKDELKGVASLAQDLYGLCDVICDMIKITYGEILPPLFEFLHPDISPMGMKKGNYASGTDLQAIKDIFSQLKSWLQKTSSKKIMDKIKDSKHDGTTIAEIGIKIDNLESCLIDFEKRYGDKRYISINGFRSIPAEKKLTLADLDPKARSYVESIMRQKQEHDMDTGPNQEKYEITRAIEYVLDDIKREIVSICSWVTQSLYAASYRVEHEKKMAEPKALAEFSQKHDRNAPDFSGLYAQFWHTGLAEALKDYDIELKKIDTAQNEMNGFISKAWLVYCAVCRKKYVKLHQQHYDGTVSSDAICDDCISESKDVRQLTAGHWNCDYCGKKIYNFAHGNILSDVLINRVPTTIKLDYGRVEIEVTCNDRDCNKKQWKMIDWGWLP